MPRNIIIAASLPVPPDKLFNRHLDPASHAAFTGFPVTIESRARGGFGLSMACFRDHSAH